MTDDHSAPRATPGLFIPFVLLAVGLIFSLLWQIAGIQAQRSAFVATKAQLADAIQKREPQVAQAIEIKNRLEALAIDLLELSKTDQTAQTIVKKHGIERALPAAAAEPGK